MKVLRNLIMHRDLTCGVVAAIGNFDGVHLGHQYLLTELRKKSIAKNLPMLVIIFEPQPREYFSVDGNNQRLTPLRDKLKILSKCGADYVLCLRFNEHIANMSAKYFAEKIIFEALHVKYLIVGNDFKFGKNRQGDVALLANLSDKYNCEVANCFDYILNKQRISSTQIRKFINLADFNTARTLLGRNYSLSGRVVYGAGQARKWGVPTANVHIAQIPLVVKGVYCVQIKLKTGIILPGVANIGYRPTIAGKKQVLEVHVLEYAGTLYGELVEVFFLHKLRDEIKFATIDDLVTRIKLDVQLAKEYFLIN